MLNEQNLLLRVQAKPLDLLLILVLDLIYTMLP